jgi:undecaprenyl diphosphate synthase
VSGLREIRRFLDNFSPDVCVPAEKVWMRRFAFEQPMEEGFRQKQKSTAERLGISPQQMPRHIAIIMDGNGRWAQKNQLPRAEGHRQGGKTVERIAQHCVNLGIECLTLYSFSTENWKRPKNEVDALMYLYARYLEEIRSTLMKNNVRLVHLGRLVP